MVTVLSNEQCGMGTMQGAPLSVEKKNAKFQKWWCFMVIAAMIILLVSRNQYHMT